MYLIISKLKLNKILKKKILIIKILKSLFELLRQKNLNLEKIEKIKRFIL